MAGKPVYRRGMYQGLRKYQPGTVQCPACARRVHIDNGVYEEHDSDRGSDGRCFVSGSRPEGG